MATQTVNGKAFEYALIFEFYSHLHKLTKVTITKNEPFFTAKGHFESFEKKEQTSFLLSASAAINFLIDIEPRLSHTINDQDILTLEIVSDQIGQSGDVRDVLTIRTEQNWQIGVSAKNNHRAVKHSRLSMKIDFGEKWLNKPCSQAYFATIKPIFDMLREIKLKDKNTKWTSIENMHETVYIPILQAFRTELLRLDAENPSLIAKNLVHYLIGTQDFYKIIKGKRKIEIQAYNIKGSLNQPYEKLKPKAKIPKLKLPSRLIEVTFKGNSNTTLIVSLDEGWQISFRIHNASSRVEPSLKFDINLISAPHTLFVQHLFLD